MCGRTTPQCDRYVERVGDRLLDDTERYRVTPVEARPKPRIVRAEFDASHVAEPDEEFVGLLDDDVRELLRLAQVGLGKHRKLAVVAFDASGGHLDILRAQRRFDVERRQFVTREAVGMQPDAHRVAIAVDLRLCNVRASSGCGP